VAEKRVPLETLIKMMTVNPRKILQLPMSSIKEGEEANLTIMDLDTAWTVDAGKFNSLSRNTPFHGWKLKGGCVAVLRDRQMIWGPLKKKGESDK
jgi:dihydroorotase